MGMCEAKGIWFVLKTWLANSSEIKVWECVRLREYG